MAEIANVGLKLSNRAENVLVVRQAINGLAEILGLDAVETNDIATAVTEACNNVVLHAYPDGEGSGTLEVEVCAAPQRIVVTVRDHGAGIGGRGSPPEDGGIGLPVMQALAELVRFSEVPGGGTEVRMEFPVPNARAVDPLSEAWEPAIATRAQLAGTVEMTLAPGLVARGVLPRVLSALAARAYFSTDRISDVQLVADALVDNARDSILGSHFGVGVKLAPRDLELRVGPLRPGTASGVLDAAGPVLTGLTDEHEVAGADTAEILALRILERR